LEITNSVFTALFVGLVWCLIKVVEFFIKKYSNKSEKVLAGEDEYELIKIISDQLATIKDNGTLTENQEKMIEEILEHTRRLYELHNVYNEDHTLAWYVHPEIITLARQSQNCLVSLEKTLDNVTDEIKDEQGSIINKIIDLVSSQRALTERLSDLISTLNRLSK